jgi:uncharacterized protein YjbI with pentapeptide repeats
MIGKQFGRAGTQAGVGKMGRNRPSVFVQVVWFVLMVAIACLLPMLTLAPVALAEDYDSVMLIGADFSGQDLTKSSFTRAKLRDSNLSHANLQGVSLFGATLEGANLEGADLRNATLDTARLTRANLTDALLEGAFAFNAKFDGAVIDGADFTDVELRKDAQTLLCKVAKGTNPITGRQTRETLNCL